jgi:hypothetical protein
MCMLHQRAGATACEVFYLGIFSILSIYFGTAGGGGGRVRRVGAP